MQERSELESWIGAVLAPEVRSAGTFASPTSIVPDPDVVRRFPPSLVVAFGRTPTGARSPHEQLALTRSACDAAGVGTPLVACDLEQGAGLHFAEATRLPPALALASAAASHADERAGLDWIRAAGETTGRQARACGVGLVLAPVVDVNTERSNPIVAARSFGDRPDEAARRAAAFCIGLHAAGALACAKHFPGHGDTRQDSHIELARVERDAEGLRAIELAPFRALIEHGVDACMVGHLDAPALTGERGLPATLSRRAIEDVLRGELGFRGVVLSDAMNMGALAAQERRYARAIAAGCDVLLCPHDLRAAAEELRGAVRAGELSEARLREAAERALELRAASERRAARAGAALPSSLDEALADELARSSLRWSGAPWSPSSSWNVRAIAPLVPGAEFRAAWDRATEDAPLPLDDSGSAAPERGPSVALAVLEYGALRGSYGLSREDEERLRDAVARPASAPRALVWFGTPQTVPAWAFELPHLSLLVAIAPTPVQVRAAVRALRTGAS